jgi:Male gamete fusion factor
MKDVDILQNACKRPVGSCLGYQLTDLAAADSARTAAGTTPLYMISRYGGGASNTKQVAVIVWSTSHSKRHIQVSQRMLQHAWLSGDIIRACARRKWRHHTSLHLLWRRAGIKACELFHSLQGFSRALGSSSQLFLALPVAAQTNSLVVLSVAADDLKLVTNRSPGNITGAQVLPWGHCIVW